MEHGRVEQTSRHARRRLGRRRGPDAPAPDSEGQNAAMNLALAVWARVLGPEKKSKASGYYL